MTHQRPWHRTALVLLPARYREARHLPRQLTPFGRHPLLEGFNLNEWRASDHSVTHRHYDAMDHAGHCRRNFDARFI